MDYIENNTLRLEVSHRGGGIEISLEKLLSIDGARMSAYQNYLGGGMLGSIQNSYNFNIDKLPASKLVAVKVITEQLNRYYYELSNGEAEDYDEWSGGSYEQVQSRPASAY